MTYAGTYRIISGKILEDGRIEVEISMKEASGSTSFTIRFPAGSVICIGDAYEITDFGFLPDSA